MADKTEELFQAYLDMVETEAGVGGSLTWAESWFAVRNPRKLPESFQANLPLILFYPSGDIPVSPDCLPGLKDRKIYTVTASVFAQTLSRDNPNYTWVSGDSYIADIASKIKNMETVFRRETFDITAVCKTIRISFRDLFLPATYEGMEVDQGHITFEHIYQDRF